MLEIEHDVGGSQKGGAQDREFVRLRLGQGERAQGVAVRAARDRTGVVGRVDQRRERHLDDYRVRGHAEVEVHRVGGIGLAAGYVISSVFPHDGLHFLVDRCDEFFREDDFLGCGVEEDFRGGADAFVIGGFVEIHD